MSDLCNHTGYTEEMHKHKQPCPECGLRGGDPITPEYITAKHITLTEKDIGRWVIYDSGFKKEQGKIKSFNNDKQIAWVVYNANENWDADHWKDYTAACTNYSDLDL